MLAALVVKGLLAVAVKSPGSGDEGKRILRNIALHTNGRVITEELHIQLRTVRISGLGGVAKVTIGKNSAVVKVRNECELVSFEPEARIPLNNPTLPVQSTRIQIGGGLHAVLSPRGSTDSTDSL